MSSPNQSIVSSLKTKAVLKQDVYDVLKEKFDILNEVLEACVTELSSSVEDDKRVQVDYRRNHEFESELKVAGDVLVFQMHSNIFLFDKTASLWKTSYVKEDEDRAYVGVINIYNFLADSIKYHRLDDIGYLIGRIFLNKDGHFFVQGKKQLGILFNDFVNSKFDENNASIVLNAAIQYTVDFDLYVPPYEHVQQATVYQLNEMSKGIGASTGKRLGFKFQFED